MAQRRIRGGWFLGVVSLLAASSAWGQHAGIPQAFDAPVLGDAGLVALAVGAGLVGSRAIRKYLDK